MKFNSVAQVVGDGASPVVARDARLSYLISLLDFVGKISSIHEDRVQYGVEILAL